MKEQAKDLPTLVDNSGNFTTVEKQTSTSLTKSPKAAIIDIQYPKVGDQLYFAGGLYEVMTELRRHRFVIKWRKEA